MEIHSRVGGGHGALGEGPFLLTQMPFGEEGVSTGWLMGADVMSEWDEFFRRTCFQHHLNFDL